MKAIRVQEHGGIEKLQVSEVPIPEIQEDEVLLRVQAVSLNHLDLWVRKGVPGHRFPLPMTPGCDIAGRVEKLGSLVQGYQVGDRVAVAPGYAGAFSEAALSGQDQLDPNYGIFGETRDGGLAEYVSLPARNLMKMSEKMSFEAAAAFPLTFLTAWGMLVNNARLQAGEDILIHAAGSGVSVACIQIAKLLGASKIFATAGSPEKLKQAEALGVDVAMNYREEDFLKIVKEETNRAGIDVVVDHVGPDTFNQSLRSLKRGGRLVTCGATSGGEVELNLRLVFFKSLKVLGSTMAPRSDLVKLWKLHCMGQLQPVVDRIFPVSEIAAAHEYLESRQAFGKVVIDLSQGF